MLCNVSIYICKGQIIVIYFIVKIDMGFTLTHLLYILLHRGVYQPPAPSLHSVSYFSLTSFLDWLFDPENFLHYPWPLLLVVVCFSNHTKFFIYFKYTNTQAYTNTHTYIHIDISCLFLAENNCCLVASFSPAACLCPLPPACLPCNPRSYCTKNKRTTSSTNYESVMC